MSELYDHKPLFDHASFSFVQDGNTLGSTDETEEITIDLLTQLPSEEPFIVIKTTGWSVDSASELTALIEQCMQAVKTNNNATAARRS